MRRALLALLAVAVLAPAAQAATPTRPVYDSQGRLVQAPFAPAVEPAELTEQKATALFLADEKVADWLDRYRKGEPRDRRDLRQGTARLGGGGVVERRRPDRNRPRRRQHRGGDRGLDRPAGRMEDGARRRRRLRREADQQPADLARLLRDLPPRARRSPPSAQRPEPRPARAALVLGLALVLQPRRHLHERAARLSADALPPRADGLVRLARRAGRFSRRLADLAARRRHGLPGRVPHRAQRARLERDRRRLLRRDRRPPHRPRRVPVRAHAEAGRP